VPIFPSALFSITYLELPVQVHQGINRPVQLGTSDDERMLLLTTLEQDSSGAGPATKIYAILRDRVTFRLNVTFFTITGEKAIMIR
jgi:hypothetical protein